MAIEFLAQTMLLLGLYLPPAESFLKPPDPQKLSEYLERKERFSAEQRQKAKREIEKKMAEFEELLTELRERKANGKNVEKRIELYEKLLRDCKELHESYNRRP